MEKNMSKKTQEMAMNDDINKMLDEMDDELVLPDNFI
jgi:hypothetical protein